MGLENFAYSHTIGIASFLGRGFMNPVDMRLDSKGILFVLSRSNAGNQDVRISVQTLDSEYMYEFGRWGTDPGQTTQPTAIAIDKDDRVFVTDEFMHSVSIFDREGNFIDRWGEFGDGDGQFNRPSGMAIDSEGNIHIVDHLNARVQKLAPDGSFISSFGTFGTGSGEFNFPWGISIDGDDGIWIADWRNDRVQRFTPDGTVYVADWRNDRVQVFAEDGSHYGTLVGDATLSKWCEEFLDVNPEQASWRENAGLFELEQKFWRPSAIETSDDGLVLIADSCRHRIQIYRHMPVLAAVSS